MEEKIERKVREGVKDIIVDLEVQNKKLKAQIDSQAAQIKRQDAKIERLEAKQKNILRFIDEFEKLMKSTRAGGKPR